MKREHLYVSPQDLRTALVAYVRNRVFHVTCRATLAPIIETGAVVPNVDGVLTAGFPSSAHSYYKRRGCVCVFDYRDVDDPVLQTSLDMCAPHDAAHNCDDQLAILFLNDVAVARLDKSATTSSGEMFVPHVEAGYPGRLSLVEVDAILEVSIQRKPDPFVDRLRDVNRSAP